MTENLARRDQFLGWMDSVIPTLPDGRFDETMHGYSSLMAQCSFFRDELYYLTHSAPEVVSHHISKRVKLPVVRYELEHAVVHMRDNFHGFVISVLADFPIWLKNFPGLPEDLASNSTNPCGRDEVFPCYAEGFDPSWVQPAYYDGSSEFTIALGSKYCVWMFMAQLLKAQEEEL